MVGSGFDLKFLVAVSLSFAMTVGCTTNGSKHDPLHPELRGERDPMRPPPLVDNEAFGRSRRSLNRAIEDLKRVKLWGPLTSDLYRIELGSRLGQDDIPTDGHLADAYSTGVLEGDQKGALCDVMFYVEALRSDLRRWRSYHSEERVSQTPPSRRHFWAMVLAHELAHCLPHSNGERAAKQWESRAYQALMGLAQT
jgi:hypothetical protein